MDLGAIVAPEQLARIRDLVEQGGEEGVEPWNADTAVPEKGCFYLPTLITGVHPSSLLAQVEIFGPVQVSSTFRTPPEAVMLANNTPYGLAASVWSENINQALHLSPQLKAGVVWINSTNIFDASSGFGGYRESGFGRESGYEGMLEYLRPLRKKSISLLKRHSPITAGGAPYPDYMKRSTERPIIILEGNKSDLIQDVPS